MTATDECFSTFSSRIENAALRDVASHWNEVRGSKIMPAWRDIDAVKIARHLTMIWSFRYDRETAKFIVRLAGDQIVAMHANSRRHMTLDELFTGEDYRLVFARFQKIVSDPCLSRDHGAVFRFMDRWCAGERVIMPIAENGENADGIIGATYYDTSVMTDLSKARFSFDNLEYFQL